MCGIGAVYSYDARGAATGEGELRAASEWMHCRGPDGSGEWNSADGRVSLAHRRLAVIDLSDAGAQPMSTADGALVISFNGEIYNYRELRASLVQKGYRFQSHTDTEVLLHLYAEKGEAMVGDLRGMFAFALWDERKKALFLARDHFGIKPLYYADDGRSIRVASEVKALLSGGSIDTTPDPVGQAGFLVWGHVPEPYTMFRGIRSLSAGSTMWVTREGMQAPRIYADLAAMLATASAESVQMDARERADRLRAAMLDTVRHHLVADVDVGVFLSAGVDSTTLAALASEAGGRLRTVTLGFAEYRGTANDETPLAEAVAKHLGTDHQTIWVTRADFREALEDLMVRMDQPTIDGVNSYFVSRAAKEAGLKVVLSGLGGDELFAGYTDYLDIPRMVRLVSRVPGHRAIGRPVRRAIAPLLRHRSSTKYASLLEYGGDYAGAYLLRRAVFLPWEVQRLLHEPEEASLHETVIMREVIRSALTRCPPAVKVGVLESAWYLRNQLLRDTDWASMTHSVEVRVPLVDWTLWREVATLGLMSPYIGKRALATTPRTQLPKAVLERKKTGFTVPMRQWMLNENWAAYHGRGLRGWARYVLERTRDGASPGVSNGREMARALVFLTDAFGGKGGIAQFNRDLLTSLCSDDAYGRVVALPRILFDRPERVPKNLTFRVESAGGRMRYVRESVRAVVRERFDVVICSHINLMPIAAAAAAAQRVPLLLVVYGIEAWTPPKSRLAARLVKRADAVVAISEHTKRRFLEWSGVDAPRVHVIPCCVDAGKFGLGPKRDDLLEKYGLQGRKVLLTVARLSGAERAKGIDEVMESLTDIARDVPNVSYLVVGEGTDRQRLERRATELGVSARVVFAGFVSEQEKADHYRLADLFVMPGRGEGFGIVYLEALACGLQIVASSLDASGEVVLNRRFGRVVNPDRPGEIKAAVVDLLKAPAHSIPRELSTFSVARFRARWNWLLTEMKVGNLASLPALSREPATSGVRADDEMYGVESPTQASSPVALER